MATTTKAAGDGETTYLDTEQRVKRAEELICDQWTSRAIVEKICGEFGVVDRTAYTAIKIAYERLASDAANERGIRKARLRASLQKLYRKALSKDDNATALRALDQLSKIDGLYEPEKIIHETATISVEARMDQIVDVLDAEGLAALEVVMAQVEAARQRGLLAEATDANPKPRDEVPLLPTDDEAAVQVLARDGKPVPMPVQGRGRKTPKTPK